MKITILGAGSFGTAFAAHLALFGHEVKMWTRNCERAEHINKFHRNNSCFSETELPHAVSAASDIAEALAFSQHVVMAIPTQSQREVCGKIAPLAEEGVHMLNLAKGIEISTGSLLHQLHKELCPQLVYSALSGPSHAEELLLDMPTTVVVASKEESEARMWQKTVSAGSFRIYAGTDVIGLEVGGATKNIYAVAAGISKALKLGDNALAALACRGLAEIMRFGAKLGANPLTLSGLAGAGDLMVTCYSIHSRNFRLGLGIGSGKTLKEASEELGQVAEGAYTVRAVVENAQKFDVEMPLAEAVYRVLYKNESPTKLIKELFARPLKAEMRF
ncbi:MAG: NAD(P)H-dependent glycerol-3-phosphate dehydrogenase [Synergistes jonesii]|uniref:NAD(P)H-dependent glycerol-3-phosphate dehydrogenase n=1 Tax=Synergistes jonesii TaxID=2754 RepID=UPI002A75D3D9|nr:NAD(P)H-dependent glycerol-3-phosphate dehydrogenase [Synergistes jonesii]MDY2984910.1 NAD(P)H-dependent glycerol-3-phosphate dehydrogenase [Synergistes jonesii]